MSTYMAKIIRVLLMIYFNKIKSIFFIVLSKFPHIQYTGCFFFIFFPFRFFVIHSFLYPFHE